MLFKDRDTVRCEQHGHAKHGQIGKVHSVMTIFNCAVYVVKFGTDPRRYYLMDEQLSLVCTTAKTRCGSSYGQ